jgi:hypothetical protein
MPTAPTAMRILLLMGYEMYLADQYRAGRLSLRDVAADDTLASFTSLVDI